MWRRLAAALAVLVGAGCTGQAQPAPKKPGARHAHWNPEAPVGERVEVDDSVWKQLLTGEQFRVLRTEGTERAFTGALWAHKEDGVYLCAACGAPLYDSKTKFKSGTGWPSFFQPVDPKRVATTTDSSFGMTRVEVHCARCGGHLGHIFPDGPEPTGQRHCINSASLEFSARASPKAPGKSPPAKAP